MNWADWTIIAILFVSCFIGLIRGFVKEALSLACWAAAFVIAMTFRAPFAQFLAQWIETPSVRELLSFSGLFALTLIVGSMVNYLISELIRMTGLSGTDRLFGMIFGAARGVIVVLAILLLVPPVIPIHEDVWWSQSLLIPHFLTMEGFATELMALVTAKVTSLF